jgi:hypothetical protein
MGCSPTHAGNLPFAGHPKFLAPASRWGRPTLLWTDLCMGVICIAVGSAYMGASSAINFIILPMFELTWPSLRKYS